MQCRTLPPLHGHAAPGPGLFFFVVVWLMAQSDPQLLELLHLFSAAGVGTECCVTLPLRFREA